MKVVKFLFILSIILTGCSPSKISGETLSTQISQATSQAVTSESSGIQPTLQLQTPAQPAQKMRATIQVATTETPYPTEASLVESTQPAVLATELITPTLSADFWKDLPVIPEINPNIRNIYQRGIELGNNPQAFSKIGDCGSTPAWFLGDFDRGPRFYQLGDYENLSTVIQVFQGSYGRTSLVAKSGFNASSIFSPLWSDPKQCLAKESPLACEYRIHKPAFSFIMLGSNDVYHPDEFEPQMRKIIETSIAQGIIPILSTKADNLEGDGQINATIARLAIEYELPLWNYWRAVQDLPDQGLQDDKVHITWGANRFNDPLSMTRGWPVRNLNALQILDALWQAVSGSGTT